MEIAAPVTVDPAHGRTAGGVRDVVVELVGEIDAAVTAGIWEDIERAMAPAGRGLVIDLSQVTFIDSAVLALLVRARRRHEAVVHGPQDSVVARIRRSGLSGYLGV
jgi:anti-anti-sigma factor